jgi:hypothetical protein
LRQSPFVCFSKHIDAAEALHSQFLVPDFENNGAMKEGNLPTMVTVTVINFCYLLRLFQMLAGRGRKGQPALGFTL